MNNILKKDISVFGKDVVQEVYISYLKLCEGTSLENKELLTEADVTDYDNWSTKLFRRFWNWIKGNKTSEVPKSKLETVKDIVTDKFGSGVKTAKDTVESTGILSKIGEFMSNGISSLFSPENLPKVLATAGGAALLGLLIRALRRKKRRIAIVEEAYDKIKNKKEVVLIEQRLDNYNSRFKYFNY